MLNRYIFNRISACLYLLLLLAVPHLASAQADDIRIDVLGTCIPQDPSTGNASTKFFAHYEQTPDSVLWDFGLPPDPADTTGNGADSLKSRQLHPIFMFPEANQYQVQLIMWSNGVADTVNHLVDIRENENELQIMDMEEEQPVSGEVVLCNPKTLEAQLTGGDGGGGGGQGGGDGGTPVEVTWYKPHSTFSMNPETSTSIELTLEQDADGRYLDAGTYYAVYDDGSGCKLSQTFRVVIWNEPTQRSSRWYFGNGAGINFLDNQPIQTNLMRGANQATEGNSMIGDENADVLFFSNGETVWYGSAHNGSETLAAEGSGLAGSRDVAQNSLFVKFPQIESLFYLFTINSARQLSLTTLDLIADPPPPGVALSETEPTVDQPIKNILVHQPVAEKITSTGRSDGGYWLVVHELGSDNFLSYPVTTEGIGIPTVSAAGTVYGNSDEDATGYMRITDGGILATAVNQGSSKFIELFRFDADSGLVTDPVQIPVNENSGTLYGLEVTDSLIYATVTNPGGPSYLYQYKYDSTLDVAAIQESEQRFETDDELGAVQLGPDGQIYIASNGKEYVYQLPNIQYDDNFQLSSTYEFELWDNTNSTLGLPNFGANAGSSVPDGVLSVTPPYCFGEDVEVSGTQRYSTDESIIFTYYKDSPNSTQIWQDVVQLQQQQGPGGPGGGPGIPQPGGEGATSTLPFSVYEPLGPGTYYVKMEITNPCGIYPDPAYGQEEIIEVFTISGRPEAQMKSDNTLELCDNQSVTFVGSALVDGQEVNPSEASFFWLDAVSQAVFATGPELTVSEAGAWLFYVVSNNGCPSDTLNVEAIDLRPEAELGDDIGICQGDNLPQQDVSVSVTNPQDFNFAWFLSIDGGSRENLNNTSTRQPLTEVDNERPGTYQYIVEITAADEQTECFKSDTIQVVVAAQPIVRISSSDNNCNGTAVLTADVEGSTDNSEISYRWVGPGIASGQGTNRITINDSGEYYVEIEDSFTQCTAQSEPLDIDLFNPLGNLSIEAEAACVAEGSDYVPNTINLISSYSGSDITIDWFELSGISQYIAIHAYQNQQSIEVDDGTYRAIVSLENPNCATVRDTVEITVARTVLPQAQLQQIYVLCPTFPEMQSETLTVSGFNRYEWRNTTTGQVLSRSESITVTQEGSYELRVDNCDEPARFRVVYDCTPKLFLPNAIRVDGTNSVFRILNENMLANIQKFQIVIMNRWGEVIYQSNDPFFQWRGTDRSGGLVMPNTYVYIITYQNQFGEDQQTIQKQRGGITVLR